MSTEQILEWARPRRILLATDLTDLAFTLPIAMPQAMEHNAELKIAHILPNPDVSIIDPVLLVYADSDRLYRAAERQLEKVVSQVQEEAHIRCSTHLAAGDAVDELVNVARIWKADRLIAGSHGKEKFHLHILGSVAESLFHRIEIPVLAVGPKSATKKASARRRKRIVFAASLDHDSRRIAEFALNVADHIGAEIWLTHAIPNVVPAHPTTGPVHEYAMRMLQDLLTVKTVRKFQPVCEVVYGQPADAILESARSHEADLIILGASAHSAFDPRFIPGTAYRVLCEATCPVLALKQESTWVGAAAEKSKDKRPQIVN
jgi:nucleotide-binding universal stress UspA family protein